MADAEPQNDPMLVAVETVQLEVDGQVFVVEKNATRLRSGHPLPQAHPELFKPVTEPKRGRSRPRKRTSS